MPTSDQGISPDRYTLIPRTLIFLTHGGQVLLIKGGPHKRLWAGRYNGIGGHVERGEDVLSAAYRELLEETGIESIDLWLCGVVTVDPGQQIGIGIFVLRGDCDQPEILAQASLYNSHEGRLEWVPVEAIQQLPVVEDLPYLVPRVMKMQRGDPPFAALTHYNEEDQLVILFNDRCASGMRHAGKET